MIKIYKYRIYPNSDQELLWQKTFGCVRFVYNWALSIKDKDYQSKKRFKDLLDVSKSGKFVLSPMVINREHPIEKCKVGSINLNLISIYEISKKLTELKKEEAYQWLNEVPSLSLVAALSNLDAAFKNFFRRVKAGEKPGFPKYKQKHGSRKAFSFHQGYKIDMEGSRIYVPKSGYARVVFHRPIVGNTSNITLTQDPSGKYYISIVVEDGNVLPKMPDISLSNMVGIDHGVKKSLTLSDGKIFNADLDFSKLDFRLKRQQRWKSRKVPGSSNYQKNKIRVARLYEKIKLKRKYQLENLVVELFKYLEEKNYTGVAIRKYQVKEMLKKNEPVKEVNTQTGKVIFQRNNRKLQKKWNGIVQNAALGTVFQLLNTKAVQYGINVIEINVSEQKTSSQCSSCGNEDQELLRFTNKREIECRCCGTIQDIDLNAARNCVVIAAAKAV